MNSFHKKKILETLSLTAGVLFIISGGFLIYSYVQSVLISLNQHDQSEIFWHLPIMFIGTALLGTGLYFNFIAYKSFKENENSLGLVKTSLKSLGIIILLLVGVIILDSVLF